MRTFGQLLHVEDIHRDGVHYRMAIFRAAGGLHCRWSCDSCTVENDDGTYSDMDQCITSMKNLISGHHTAHHSKT